MKKQAYKPLRIIFNLTSAAILLLACGTASESSRDSNEVDTPSMDIQAAILSNNIQAVREHIEAGTDLNAKEPMSGATPLISAATFGKTEIARALINAGVDLSIKNNDGSTALHTAAFFCRVEIVQLLIDANADKTIRNNFGATPRETVTASFSDVKPIYDMMILQLAPLGFELDLEELEKARPVVAMMLQ